MWIKPSNESDCFIAIRRGERLFFMLLNHSCGIITSRIIFMQALVSRRRTTVSVVVIKMPYDILSVYDGWDLGTTLVGIRASSRSLMLSTVIPIGRCVAAAQCCGLSKVHDCGVSDS